MKRLFFITNRFEQALTGGEAYNKLLIEGAKKSGYEVTILDRVSRPKFLKNIVMMNFYYLLKIVHSKSSDIFLFDTDLHARYYAAIKYASLFTRVRIVGMLHHYNYWDKTSKLSFLIHKFLEKSISKNFHYLITNSIYSKTNFEELTRKNIPTAILYPFVDTTPKQLGYNRDVDLQKLTFLHVGTLEKRKNVINVLRAFKKSGINFTFTIVGGAHSDDYFQLLKAEVKTLGFEDNVEFKGRLTDEQLDSAYQMADVFIMVSEHEGFGMVYAEAMSYGLPIIGTNRSAVPEVVKNGVNGLLCNPYSVDDITQKIIIMASEREMRETFRLKNLEDVRSFNNQVDFIKKAQEIFEKI